MKKSYLLLPLCVIGLTSCSSIFNINVKDMAISILQRILNSSSSQPSSDSSDTNTRPTTLPTVPPTTIAANVANVGESTYQGYKRLDSAPVDGKEYLVGYWQDELQKFCFIDGADNVGYTGNSGLEADKNTYPFYFETVENVSEAAKFKVSYTSTTQFSIQYVSGGKTTFQEWKNGSITNPSKSNLNKYLTILYNDDGNSKTSCYFKDTAYNWTFSEQETYKSEQYTLNTFVCSVGGKAGYAAQNCAIGSWGEYTSVSAITPDKFTTNFFCHFWEPIA